MDRDTEEWLRPWIDESGRSVGATRSSTASDVVTVRVTRPSAAAAPQSASDVDVERPGSPASDERTGRTSPFAPVDLTSSHPRAVADDRRRPGPTGVAASAWSPVTGTLDAGAREPLTTPPGRTFVAAIGLLAGLVGAAAGVVVTLTVADVEPGREVDRTATGGAAAAASTSPVVGPDDVAPGETVVSAVATAVLPSVVRIDVSVSEDDPDLGAVDVPTGVGSGVVYTDAGYVLTNHHVIDGSDTVTVQLSDGSERDAEVVGSDRRTDLAVLRLDGPGLTPVSLRVDDPLQVGETAVAIGSPFGLDASVTAGVVSAVNRDLEVPGTVDDPAFVIPGLIQTDAAINPGNSGGALVDRSGRLIGINTAILTNGGGSQGVGFAIPTRSVMAAADQLIEQGFVSHPFLGIAGLDVTGELSSRLAEEHGLVIDGGAVVDEVVDGSAAAEAGLRVQDVIVGFGPDDISGMMDVIAAILRYDVGETVPVDIVRDGERITLDVTLGERPPDDD